MDQYTARLLRGVFDYRDTMVGLVHFNRSSISDIHKVENLHYYQLQFNFNIPMHLRMHII